MLGKTYFHYYDRQFKFFPVSSEQQIFDMQYALLRGRGLQPSDEHSSMSLLYMYSKYKKDLEDEAAARALAKGNKFVHQR